MVYADCGFHSKLAWTATLPTTLHPLHHFHCRADWKACAASKAEEEARTERFKKAFAPYDIMQ